MTALDTTMNEERPSLSHRAATRPILLALATAVPPRRYSRDEVETRLAAMWRLTGAARGRWHRIVAGSGVDFRHTVAELDDILHLSTGDRMRLYESHAPTLAAAAAQRVLDQVPHSADRVTDLIIVSCTGFAAPGVDVALIDRLGLSPRVRRSTIGFMGCFGGILGLRAAVGCCCADPGALALVVCVELCSLHVRDSTQPDNLVATALFGDGAAAALVSSPESCAAETACPISSSGLGSLDIGASYLCEHGRDEMTWRITDHGFAMTLAPRVPDRLRADIRRAVGVCGKVDQYLVHPGGPRILEAIEDGLGIQTGDLGASRNVLRRYGNISSAAILFVLREGLRRGINAGERAALIAFGPGLTIESLPFEVF